ncbi:putative isocitrate lyase/malate synthase [Talaromyces proteolyticus]|uniref:Isocitrate lyase/malate synthase n=1 Tax=Talaromyces proteolyticus TaxID=1131652 RepID=A0AAD4KL72_9EURO|nr:putative isocitrate lyase/malate synthase [Talaromyces proteolyticus]KAH8692802.1 putative isocitrate lyase/malate synthase [Talaromyces proteolyticus]
MIFTISGLYQTSIVNLTMSPSTQKLRQFLADPDKIIVGPGVYDGLTARMALAAKFDTLYMTGAGTSMSRLGMADLGLATQSEMKENAEMIANLDPSVPVIADADTGYGASVNVGRTVARYISAGVAGFHLEDQVVNKRCGHLAGKQIVSRDEYYSRIRAAVNMRRQLGSDIVIIARTDALQSLGFDEALVRLKEAVAIGADVAFMEAIQTREQAIQVCNAFKEAGTPVMYGMVQGSKSPHFTVQEAKDIGIKIMIYAGVCLIPAYIGVSRALKKLKEDGDTESYGSEITPHELFNVCGMKELMEFDRQAAISHAS